MHIFKDFSPTIITSYYLLDIFIIKKITKYMTFVLKKKDNEPDRLSFGASRAPAPTRGVEI